MARHAPIHQTCAAPNCDNPIEGGEEETVMDGRFYCCPECAQAMLEMEYDQPEVCAADSTNEVSGGFRVCIRCGDDCFMLDPTEEADNWDLCEPSASAYDEVDHPAHYTQHPSDIECIQITKHMNFCIGNAIKYLWRANLKDEPTKNLEKARWYITREIERLRGE